MTRIEVAAVVKVAIGEPYGSGRAVLLERLSDEALNAAADAIEREIRLRNEVFDLIGELGT